MKDSSVINRNIPECKRTFKAWFMELRKLVKKMGINPIYIKSDSVKGLFDSGLSPKMVIKNEFGDPVPDGWDVL